MNRVILKNLKERRWFLLGWGLGFFGLSLLMTSFFTSFNGGQIDQLMSSMPKEMQGLVGELQDWRELPAYLASQIYDIRLSIILGIFCIMLALSISTQEEDRGELATLLSLPISRVGAVLAKWVVVAIGGLLAAIATLAGIGAGLLVIGETIDPMVLVRLSLFSWLLAVAIASIPLTVGLATGRKGLTTLVAVIWVIVSFIVSTFAVSVDWMQKFEPVSVFNYFVAVDIANGIVDWANVVVYIGAIAVGIALALIFFTRRDVRS